MGVDITGAKDEDAGDLLSGAIIKVMKKTGVPNGLKTIGFGVQDVEELVEGTLL